MSDHPAISFEGVGKMYKVFSNRTDNLLNALGMDSLARWRKSSYREFWALRGIDFEVAPGERLGIIGRNGAGKSTILKLITGNLAPTEGTIRVTGQVQALLEIGGGLHPEFTGRENIHAALVHLGLSSRQIADATEEIADFTELGSFLDQPFKTYSLGMQARLSFAIGTTVQPEILIIDEILGAGDAYFIGKSTARMQSLIESGASVLLVSHGLDHIVRFCDEALWIDRGRVAMRGPSMEVVKAYEKFIRELEDRRLQAKNQKARQRRFDAFAREGYTDYFTVQITPPEGSYLDVASVQLFRDGVLEDEVAVGGPQDGDTSQSAYLQVEGAWSSPLEEDGAYSRRVDRTPTAGVAQAVFSLWFFYPDSRYEVLVRYRTPDDGASVAIGRGGVLRVTTDLAASAAWTNARIDYSERSASTGVPLAAVDRDDEQELATTRLSRWPGEGSLLIEGIRLVESSGEEQAVFAAGSEMRLVANIRAMRSRTFELTPAATLYRADGILVTNNPGTPLVMRLEEGETFTVVVDFGELNLGDGKYVFSFALFQSLNHLGETVAYDLVDRSYEFEVRGNETFNNGIFRHAATWTVERTDSVASREEIASGEAAR